LSRKNCRDSLRIERLSDARLTKHSGRYYEITTICSAPLLIFTAYENKHTTLVAPLMDEMGANRCHFYLQIANKRRKRTRVGTEHHTD